MKTWNHPWSMPFSPKVLLYTRISESGSFAGNRLFRDTTVNPLNFAEVRVLRVLDRRLPPYMYIIPSCFIPSPLKSL
jgi:hypothetical protein